MNLIAQAQMITPSEKPADAPIAFANLWMICQYIVSLGEVVLVLPVHQYQAISKVYKCLLHLPTTILLVVPPARQYGAWPTVLASATATVFFSFVWAL